MGGEALGLKRVKCKLIGLGAKDILLKGKGEDVGSKEEDLEPWGFVACVCVYLFFEYFYIWKSFINHPIILQQKYLCV